MKLQDEIKQSSFDNNYQKLAVNILYTHSWLQSKIKELFKEYNITMQQYNILRILRGQHPKALSISSIKERMLDKMSDTSRIVDRLIVKKLVLRKQSQTDKRKSEVYITQKGLTLLDNMSEIENLLVNVLSNLSEEETQTLNNLLDKARG